MQQTSSSPLQQLYRMQHTSSSPLHKLYRMQHTSSSPLQNAANFLLPFTGHIEKHRKWKLEMEMQPLSCCIIIVFEGFVCRWLLFLGIPELSWLQFLISCFAILALFPGLCHLQYFITGKYWGQQWLGTRLLHPHACVK